MNVYLLRDPNDLKVKYVGITRKPVTERLRVHIKDSKARLSQGDYLSKKERWLLMLALSGKKPIIETVCADISEEEAIKKERALIEKYRREKDGGTLKNVMKGVM